MTLHPTKARVFIGYDEGQPLAWHVLAHSIILRSSIPVEITPIVRSALRPHYVRARDPRASTDFSDTRFLVPWLCSFQGWAVFMDSDQLMLSDIAELWAKRDNRYAVMVRKHTAYHAPGTKFLGHEQASYPRKNWSSLMLMNCGRWDLWPAHVAGETSVASLHRFTNLPDYAIGDLPSSYNHLVNVEAHNPDAKHVHYTLGGPWLLEYMDVPFSDDWRAVCRKLFPMGSDNVT